MEDIAPKYMYDILSKAYKHIESLYTTFSLGYRKKLYPQMGKNDKGETMKN